MTNSEREALKPCPFCGEAPESKHETYGWEVACKNFYCQISPSYHRHIAIIPAMIDEVRRSVEKIWNTRAKQAQPHPQAIDGEVVERIKDILQWADGWEDGETFYKSAIEEIRAALSAMPQQASINDDSGVEFCVGCSHIGPRPLPPSVSCCPERDTVRLPGPVAEMAKRGFLPQPALSEDEA